MDVRMGVRVKSRVTGFMGIVAGRTEYLNGCIQWLVKPPVDKDGKEPDGIWIDIGSLEVVDQGIAVVQPEETPGGPQESPPTSYRQS